MRWPSGLLRPRPNLRSSILPIRLRDNSPCRGAADAPAAFPVSPGNAGAGHQRCLRSVQPEFAPGIHADQFELFYRHSSGDGTGQCHGGIAGPDVPDEPAEFPQHDAADGGNIDTEQSIDVAGRQGRLIAVTMKNPQANASFHAMNVFIPGPNLWIQVMGPEQNTPQIGQVLQSVLGGLRF